jgi:hypothetical protein
MLSESQFCFLQVSGLMARMTRPVLLPVLLLLTCGSSTMTQQVDSKQISGRTHVLHQTNAGTVVCHH